jgi:hypothetical protein
MKSTCFIRILLSFVFAVLSVAIAFAQTTAFSYQGRLTDAGNPANGAFQMQFSLFDSLKSGTQIGATLSDVAVTANQGIFGVKLDFGASALDGTNRWLEIAVRRNAGESYTTLSPREQIASSPYSVRTLSAAQADLALDSNKLGGVVSSEYVTTTSVGNTFIKNDTTQQTTANFNIDGNGAVGGNLGIGTDNPQTKLDVRGSLTLESGASPVLYTSTAAAEQNRYLQLINSFVSPSASGLKAGGILVADNFSFFDPGKNNLVVKGNVGIGTGVVDSSSKLVINGQNALDISGFQPFFDMRDTSEPVGISPTLQRIQAVNGALVFHRRPPCFTLPCPPFGNPPLIIDAAGNIGISKSNPSGRLHIFHPGNVSSIFLSTGSGSEGAATFRLQADSGLVGQGRSFVIYSDDAAQYRMVINGSGNVGFGTVTPTAKLDVVGTTKTSVLQITGGSDLAENFEFAEKVKPGMVVAIDSQNAGKLAISRRAYNRSVVGIVSGANNLSAGMILPDLNETKNSMPVALSGRVWVYCDAAKNPIQAGDLLTSSATPGYAMKVKNYRRAQGAIIGKAMTELKSGTGLVLVLVSLQ